MTWFTLKSYCVLWYIYVWSVASFNLITSFWKRLGLYLKLMNVKWDNINRNTIWSKSDNDALQHRQCVLYASTIFMYMKFIVVVLKNSKQHNELKIESFTTDRNETDTNKENKRFSHHVIFNQNGRKSLSFLLPKREDLLCFLFFFSDVILIRDEYKMKTLKLFALQ